jgi:hypothetical protein
VAGLDRLIALGSATPVLTIHWATDATEATDAFTPLTPTHRDIHEEPIMSMPASGRPPHLVDEHPTFVTHLECGLTGEVLPADTIQGSLPAGRPLLVRYDLEAAAAAVDRATVEARHDDWWKYREILPVRRSEDIVSLGETFTPLVSIPRTTARLGAKWALVKDEGRLPTGSFKARGLAMAVAMAKELGLTPARDADERQRRCGDGRVRVACRHGDVHLLPG